MADFDLRNPAQDDTGSGAGLIIAGIIILAFLVAMLFMGGEGSMVTEGDAAAPAATEDIAPAATDTVPATDG